MPKFKIGDEVTILPAATKTKSFVDSMCKFIGSTGCITGMATIEDRMHYRIDESGDWWWDESGLAAADITATITVEGREIPIKLNRSDLEKLLAVTTEPETPNPEPQKRCTGFERVEKEDNYYFIDGNGRVQRLSEDNYGADDALYETANYYSNHSLAEWCNRSDTLARQMRRWAAEHNSDFGDTFWSIAFSPKLGEVTTYKNNVMNNSCVYFSSPEIADTAIAEFGEEIKWLYENRPTWF